MIDGKGNWRSFLLSWEGKETLVKVFLQAIPSYVFSCFMFPDGLLNKVDDVIATFWRSGDVNRKSLHWCSKERMTQTKKMGGLGFNFFKEFKLAHLAKMSWRIIGVSSGFFMLLL
ncbi:Putative ribonuclease H protein At1g65750 [Linum perenne]